MEMPIQCLLFLFYLFIYIVANPADRDLSVILNSKVKDFVYALDRHDAGRSDMIQVRRFVIVTAAVVLLKVRLHTQSICNIILILEKL